DMTSIWKIRFRFGEGGYNTYSNAQTHPYQVLLDNLYVYNTLEPNIRVSATTNLQNARLTWTSVNFIEEPFAYTVRYSSDKGNTWTTASTAAVSPYIVTGLSSGVDYLFEVEGVSGIQWGTGRASATTLVPFAPTYAWEPSNVYSLYSTQYGVAEQYGSGGMLYANGTVTNHVIDATHTVEKYNLAGLTGNRPQYGMLWIVDFLGNTFGQYNYWHVDLFIPDNEVTRTITHIRFWDSEFAGNYTDIPVQALGTWSRYDVPIQRESTYRLLIVPMVDDSYPASEYSLFMDHFLLYKSSTAVKSLQASPNIRVYARDAQIMVDLEGSEVLHEVKVWNLSGQSLPGDVRYDGNHASLSVDSGIHLIQVVTNTGSWLYKILR
ncbi:MAG: fibronectin type III domain-containing protein, partial [Paludibacteraceae bacterium]|nr:fibronectin type III domain-containing protein [Paludibacteraceae bacterium]